MTDTGKNPDQNEPGQNNARQNRENIPQQDRANRNTQTLAAIQEARHGLAEGGIPIGSALIVGESRTFFGARNFLEQHGVHVIDLDLPECYEMMADFIRDQPTLWNEDIAE